MDELKTRNDLEIYADSLASRMGYLPENLRLLIVLQKEDFESLMHEVVPPWAQIDQEQPDRFIYTSQSGVEYGIKMIE